MSYAIIRNDKLTRVDAQGSYIHNDRRSKGHSNKDIDPTRTHLNFYCKENTQTYIKEFDRMKKELDLKGNIRSNSIIMCEMMITSDNEFFNKIGLEETKRYFIESYKFVCNYKNLGEKNIVSAAVHLDETTPHMHLVFIPVIHTKDEQGNAIDKICAKDFWRGRDSYRKLQNDFHKYVTSKGFDLERGLPVEETGAKNLKIEELKKITNFANTKKLLNNIKLELPEVPDINDIKLIQLNKAKVEKDIIKPQNDLIKELHEDNLALHKELSKQAKLIDEAEKYQKERNIILADNEALNERVKLLEHEYKKKSNTLDLRYDNKVRDLEKEFKEKSINLENKFYNRINELEKENYYLNKIINKFKE
ncbi:MAG: plasmid recombination protein, partial [Clostridia bacterium]|nr:plasmid recombination protein [Clostridia bacterium]